MKKDKGNEKGQGDRNSVHFLMEDKVFDLVEKMYVEMQEGFDGVNKRIDSLETEVKETKNKIIVVEEEHGKKLTALFDGYKQNSDKLDRIENEVSKHEEII